MIPGDFGCSRCYLDGRASKLLYRFLWLSLIPSYCLDDLKEKGTEIKNGKNDEDMEVIWEVKYRNLS